MNNVEIETAKNGKEALAIIENPDSKLPDLILLDLKMPVFDGYEFLEYLNSIEFTHKDHLNVILLTTSMNPEDKTRILKFKFVSSYLIKPLSRWIKLMKLFWVIRKPYYEQLF
tara:strand:+ start:3525 stop:3863 length:339 start_codon:yes stop_codon:yes gene_type:complete